MGYICAIAVQSGVGIKVFENPKDKDEFARNQFDMLGKKTTKVTTLNTIQENQVFVLIPFRPYLKPVYEENMKTTMERLGYQCFIEDFIFFKKANYE